jgi:bifunctional NMN adenylyltransferase/nudix hydrolase
MKYNAIVYIGRFQPAHRGHIATMREALEKANHLIVVIGSHNTPRTPINPWTAEERKAMILMNFNTWEWPRIHFVYAENRLYSNTFWARNVEKLVNEKIAEFEYVNPTIGIIGNGKGDTSTSEYINLFKKWVRVPMGCIAIAETPLHATKIRELMFTGHVGLVEPTMEPETFRAVVQFTKTDTFAALKTEYDYYVQEDKKYEKSPYQSYTRYTADSVVIQSGHVLLIQRIKAPGKGLWALPGGHVEQDETSFEASLRELDEETCIKIQKEVLERCMFDKELFDHPERSLVGRLTQKYCRTATMAYGYKLDDKRDLPSVKPGDDAKEARWFTFEEVATMRDQLFEDHADIIEYFLARVPN